MAPRVGERRWRDPREARVHDLLGRLVGSGAAAFFGDACEIIAQQPPYPTTTNIVGHLMRETESAMREVLLTLPAVRERYIVPEAKDAPKHEPQVLAVLQGLALTDNDTANAWLSGFVGKRKSLHGDAHRDGVRAARPADDAFRARFETFVGVLGVVLDAAEADYLQVLSAVESVLAGPDAWKTNSHVDLLALHLGPGTTATAHVFRDARLTVDWLRPLLDKCIFETPPRMITHADGSISFPHWPQTDYLARIAPVAPSQVVATILAVPVVDNEDVHRAFLLAALAMPAKEAAEVARHETEWLSTQARWIGGLLGMAVKELALHLINGNECKAAAALLKCSLTFDGRVDSAGESLQPEPRIAAWDYDATVSEVLRPLAERVPALAEPLLVQLLNSAQFGTFSTWRAVVEDHPQNGAPEPRDALFVELRGLYERRVYGDAAALGTTLAALEARDGSIYTRMALHLLRLEGAHVKDLVVERACNPVLLDLPEVFHELAEMIAAHFAVLDAVDQDRVIAAFRENASETHIRERPGEQAETYVELSESARRSLRDWFAILGTARPASISSEYELLCDGRPEPEHPTFQSWRWRSVQTGPNSPVDSTSLNAMGDDELVALLERWIPADDRWFGPSREGLGAILGRCAAARPGRFSRLAPRLRSVHPAYVESILEGLRHAFWGGVAGHADDDPEIDDDSILELAEWTVDQTAKPPNRDYNSPEAWSGARCGAVDVVEQIALRAVSSAHPERLRRAWKTLRGRLSDSDPTPERIAGSDRDEVALALSVVRGRALGSAINLASALQATRETDETAAFRAAILADVERRADSAVEPAIAVRCVLAWRFNYLASIDPGMAARLADALFPTHEGASDEQQAAWRVFLARNAPKSHTFEMLKKAYLWAVLGPDSETAKDLGEHLVWLAVWGVISPVSADGPLAVFVGAASVAARHHGLDMIGRATWRTKDALASDLLERLRALWDWWTIKSVESNDASDLRAFGWWFTSHAFDVEWTLPRLADVLEKTRGRIDHDREVFDKLAKLAVGRPDAVMVCMRKLVESNNERTIQQCRQAIHMALDQLSGSATTGAAAKELRARLVARGWSEFQAS